MVFSNLVLVPVILITIILIHLFSLVKLLLPSELFLCSLFSFRNLSLHLSAMIYLSYKHTYI